MKKRALIINIFGGPGVGKSCIAHGITCLLKIHGVSVEYVSEFAKDLAWENKIAVPQDQRYVWGEQHHRLYRLQKQVDAIITDSPLLLSMIYGNTVACRHFPLAVLESFNEFSNLNFVVQRRYPYIDEGRFQNEDEAKNVDELVLTMLKNYNIPYIEIESSYNDINRASIVSLQEITGQVLELHTQIIGTNNDADISMQ